MTNDGVAFADEAHHEFELRTVYILTRGLIQKHPVNLDAFELAIFVLVEGAHPHVADELALRRVPGLLCCVRFFSLPHGFVA